MLDIAPVTLGLLSVCVVLILIYLGMYVGVALMLVSFAGVWLLRDDFSIASRLLGQAASDSISDYIFGVIPLFVLMGLLVSAARLGEDCFEIAHALLHKVAGGLGVTTVAANAVFASITGISIAAAAVFSRIAVPPMVRYGYSVRFAAGVVAGSSVLGMLLPPSLLFILYGVITEQSIGSLFIAGILPGIFLALAFIAYIMVMARFAPSFVYSAARDATAESADVPKLPFSDVVIRLLPIVVLVLLVMGGIYGGVFTPTEAGAVGALGALVIAGARGRLDWKTLWNVLVDTGRITASISLLLIGASLYSRFLALSGLPDFISGLMVGADVGTPLFLTSFIVIIILLGCIIDSSSTMLISLPIAYPVAVTLGVDPIWFGVITVLGVEIGLLTPPFGLSVFVVKATLQQETTVTLNDVFAGSFPFALVMLTVLLVVCLNPWLTTVLL